MLNGQRFFFFLHTSLRTLSKPFLSHTPQSLQWDLRLQTTCYLHAEEIERNMKDKLRLLYNQNVESFWINDWVTIFTSLDWSTTFILATFMEQISGPKKSGENLSSFLSFLVRGHVYILQEQHRLPSCCKYIEMQTGQQETGLLIWESTAQILYSSLKDFSAGINFFDNCFIQFIHFIYLRRAIKFDSLKTTATSNIRPLSVTTNQQVQQQAEWFGPIRTIPQNRLGSGVITFAKSEGNQHDKRNCDHLQYEG